jgi:hypothetical protein
MALRRNNRWETLPESGVYEHAILHSEGAVGDRLTGITRRVAESLRRMRHNESCTRFEIGDEVHALRCSADIGPRSVGRLATLLGMDESGLQRLGRIAERIRGEERSHLLSLRDQNGVPLRWSIFEELERLNSAHTRLALASQVLADNLSVHELRKRIRP